MKYEDRGYQQRAIDEARAKMARGVKRFIFQAPTGSGKTFLSGILAKSIIEKNKRCIFAAHRRELVLQPYKKFLTIGIPESDIGVIKAGEEKLYNPVAPIQIVSIQTVYKKALPKAQVVIIDECHLARAGMYEWLIAQFPDAYIIGLTATPTRLDGRSLGDVFEDIVIVAQPSELFAGGWIVAPEMYTVPDEMLPNVDGVHHHNGDFKEDELNERVMVRAVMGSIPDHWASRARGLRSMLFAVTKKHSRALVDILNGTGIRAKHVDGQTSQTERDAALKELELGQIDILSQVGLWVEGLDMEPLKCAIMARPTESQVVHRQSAGRIMRPWEDVTPILLDHAGNCMRLGVPTSDKEYSLKQEPKYSSGRNGPLSRKCKRCDQLFSLDTKVCPACGIPLTADRKVKHVEDVTLVKIGDEVTKDPTEKAKRNAFNRFWQMAYRDGRDDAWVLRRYAEKFGNAPPRDWTPPDQPVIEYTVTQKRKELDRLRVAASRNNMSTDWIRQRYEAKFKEPIAALEAQVKKENESKQLPATVVAPEDIVDLEF